jgi:uncharacterized membrane protein
MDGIFMEWGSLLLRWLHIIAAIAWVGSSFYFMHIDAALRNTPEFPPGKGGELWEIHGGGFYHVQKYLVAPERLPDELIWHKWEAYTTWISGFFLLVWIYYISADIYLIDPAVRVLSTPVAASIGIGSLVLGWAVYDGLCRSKLADKPVALAIVSFAFIVGMAFFFQQIFSARGAFVHTGALMATMMAGNVLMVIIPNQRKVIASLIAGEKPDAKYGKIGKVRSTHNNYLTLPVIFLMISGHYPLTYSSDWAFVVVGLILISGGAVRHFYNMRHLRQGNMWWLWLLAALALCGAIAISIPASPVARDRLGMAEAPVRAPKIAQAQAPQDVVEIVTSRCSMCHAALPVWPGIPIAPKGVSLDTPELVQRWKHEVQLHAGLTRAMPPNNLTEMTDAERAVLRAWGEPKKSAALH